MSATGIGGIDVSRETLERLKEFQSLVVTWNRRINLVSKSSVEDLWDRHIVDSAQIYGFCPSNYGIWTDIGSGGGFPGIVCASIAKEKHPNARFTLIESDQRKATFLRTAIRELDLAACVISQRIEEAPKQNADIVTARALTSLSGLFPYILRHQKPDGIAMLHKGQSAQQEIVQAQATWTFDLIAHPSITQTDAQLLQIRRIAPIGE